MKYSAQDIAAGIVAVSAVLGLILLDFAGREIPPELGTILGVATGWMFTRATQAAEAITNGNGKSTGV